MTPVYKSNVRGKVDVLIDHRHTTIDGVFTELDYIMVDSMEFEALIKSLNADHDADLWDGTHGRIIYRNIHIILENYRR